LQTRLLSLFVFLPSLITAQDTTGAGAVIGVAAKSSGETQAGVKICLEGAGRCAVTDEKGAFRIADVRAGSYQLEITSAAGERLPVTASVEVRPGLESRVQIEIPAIEAVAQSITVSEPVFIEPEEIKSSGYLITSGEVFKAAGAIQDVSRYVQLLPGVAIASNDFRNDIIVRGGSPLENLFVVDNIEVPNINSFATFASSGGTSSLLDPAALSDVTFLSGGYPASYINRTSSVLQVVQREGARDKFNGRATLGFPGAGTLLEGPLNKGKGSWLVSARRSFLDLFTDNIGIGGVPVQYSFTGKVLYDFSPRDRVWAVSLSGVDRIRLGPTAGGENDGDADLNTIDVRYRGWRSANGVNWQRLFGDRGVGLLGIAHSEASVNQTVRDLLRGGIPIPPPESGLDEIIARSPIIFRENSREGETTLKYDFTSYIPVFEKVQTGGSFKIFNIRYNTASPLGVDSPFSPVPELQPFDIRQNYRAYQTGGYFQSTRNLTSRLNLTWGGRVDNFQYIAQTRFSPRAGVSYRITDKLSWRASYGQYYQQPFFLFLSTFPENRGLLPWRAVHYVTGFSYVFNPTLRATVEVYRKQYRDYAVSLDFPQLSLASVGDTFNIRSVLFPLTSAGRGRVQGMELFVEKKFTDKWFGQANLAFSRATQAGLDGIQRPASFDYPVIFNSVGGYRLTPKWEFSARFSYLSGRPYTPFDERLSAEQRRGIFDLTRVNELRLRDYVRLDLRLDYTFTFRDKPVLLWLGVQNAFNRRNDAFANWSRATNRAEFAEQQGLFPLIGLDWRF
jgi:outer membrane receptor protein involved in Fe transport